MQKVHFVCFILNHFLALNPFARCYLLSGGCFHGPSWELKLLSSSPALNLSKWAANKKISQARISTYQCGVLDSDGFFIATSFTCISVLCSVFEAPLWGRSLGISPELSWRQFMPPVESHSIPLFLGALGAWCELHELLWKGQLIHCCIDAGAVGPAVPHPIKLRLYVHG